MCTSKLLVFHSQYNCSFGALQADGNRAGTQPFSVDVDGASVLVTSGDQGAAVLGERRSVLESLRSQNAQAHSTVAELKTAVGTWSSEVQMLEAELIKLQQERQSKEQAGMTTTKRSNAEATHYNKLASQMAEAFGDHAVGLNGSGAPRS